MGQRVDYTGFVVVEWVRLGQGFHEVLNKVERLTHSAELSGGLVTTAVDATGLGMVVSEDLRRKRLRGGVVPGGDHGRA